MLSATEDRRQQREETKGLCSGSPGMIKGCLKQKMADPNTTFFINKEVKAKKNIIPAIHYRLAQRQTLWISPRQNRCLWAKL